MLFSAWNTTVLNDTIDASTLRPCVFLQPSPRQRALSMWDITTATTLASTCAPPHLHTELHEGKGLVLAFLAFSVMSLQQEHKCW